MLFFTDFNVKFSLLPKSKNSHESTLPVRRTGSETSETQELEKLDTAVRSRYEDEALVSEQQSTVASTKIGELPEETRCCRVVPNAQNNYTPLLESVLEALAVAIPKFEEARKTITVTLDQLNLQICNDVMTQRSSSNVYKLKRTVVIF